MASSGGRLLFGLIAVQGLAGLYLACAATEEPPLEDYYDAGTRQRESGGSIGDPSGDDGDADIVEQEALGTTCTAKPCVVEIAVGGAFSCARMVDGAVHCWGDNVDGTVGAVDGGRQPRPRKIEGLPPAKQIAAGWFHACAVVAGTGANDDVWCWGENVDGQLGRPKGPATPTPAAVIGLPKAGVKQITGGGYHTCALLAGGEVSCWGYNASGQTGSGTMDGTRVTPTNNATPTTVRSLSQVKDISAGNVYTCAVVADGGVACFGDGLQAKLGRGDTNDAVSIAAAPVLGVAGAASSLARGVAFHKHVILASGRLQGWGANGDLQIGLGTRDASVIDRATLVPGLEGVTSVTSGGGFTCAIAGGSLLCWGESNRGQTGTVSDGGPIAMPRKVDGIDAPVMVAASRYDHACALRKDGTVLCWGANDKGQLGRGTISSHEATPAPVQF